MLNSPVIKINYLVLFQVVKKLPDHDSLLCNLVGTQLFAQLPRKYATHDYKVGDTGWASVFEIKGARITLSQKSPAYVRKLIEYLLSEPLCNYELQIKKVGIYQDVFKVLISTQKELSNRDLNEIFKPYINCQHFKKHFPDGKFFFVRFYEDIEQLIKSLLVYEDRIQKVIFFKSLAQATVYTENGSVGLLVGEKGKNVMTARKILQTLTGSNIDIEIKSLQGGYK